MSSVIDLCDDSDQDQVDAFEATNHQDDSSSSSSSSSSDDEIWTASAFSQSSTASKKAPRDVSCRKPQGRRGKGLADDGNKSQNGKTRTKHSSPIEEGLNESEDDNVSYDNLQQRSLLKKTTNFLSSGTTSKDSTNSSKDDIRASPHASTQKSNTKRAIVPPSKNSGTTNTGKRQKTTGPENDEVECIEIESCSDDDLGDDFNNFNNGKKNIEKSPEKSNGPSSLLTKDATHNPYTKKNENLRRRNDWMAREEYKKSQKTKGKSTASGKTLPVITNLSSMLSVKLNSRLNGQQFLSKSSTSDDSESDDSLYVSAESSNGRKSKATTTTQPGQIRYLPRATEKCTHQSGYESEISHSSHSSQATVPLPPNLQRENGFGNRNNPSSKPDEFNENDRSEFILELSDEDIDEADNTFADEEFRIKKPMHYNLEKKEGSDYNPIQQYTTKSMSKNDSLLDMDSSDSDGIFDHLAINKESTTASIRLNETKGNRVRNPYDKTKSTAPSPSVPRKDRVDRALGSTITLSISQLKSELENIYGICTKGYLEKRELAMALAEARVDAISSATGTDPEEATNPDDSINVSFGVERSFFDCAGDKLVDYDNVEIDVGTEIPNLSKPTKTPSRDKSPNLNRIDLLESDSDVCSPLFTPQPAKMAIQQKKPSNTEKAPEYQSTKKCPGFLSSSSSKLLTPCAFSPPLNSPLATFAAKRKVPTPSIPALSNDLIKEIGGKLYPDLRHNFILALTCHARKFRHNSYQRGSFDAALRSVVVISMHLSPIRSPEAARRLKGVASHFYEILKESVAGSKGKKPYHPIKDKFSCVASAALVALLEMEESSEPMTLTNGNSFPMEDLIQNINRLIDTRSNASLNQTAQQYMDPDNLDPGWGQVKKLCATNANTDLCGPFMKERKKKGACPSGVVFELLEAGREMAKKLRDLAKKGPAEPGPLRQLPNDTVDEEFGNVTMSMDHREGGGSSKGLHTMCDQLDIRGVPYVVRELKIADYVFFIGDKLAPVLIERKSAEDVAGSLHDGRWERQQRNMRKAQYVLGDGHARRCQICYIIEGDPNKRKVHGGNVGRRTWFQSVDDCESAISELPSLGFSVMRSKGHLDTIGILAKVAQDVSWKVKNGIIDVKYTYKQFLDRIKVCDEKLGNPPTLKEHQNPAPPVVVNWNPAGLKSTNTKKTSDDPKKTDKSNNPEPAPEPNMNYSEANSSGDGENCEEISELKKMSLQALKDLCKERGDKIGGKKEDLIARLLKPRKPEILIMRARRNEYVPKIPSCNAALMVALHLHHIPGTQGLAKERLMVLAEETGVSKDSMSGDGGFYDGWSGMKDLLRGDPALVKREKGQKFSLTTQPPESSGVAVANALHILAHREGLCTCGNTLE